MILLPRILGLRSVYRGKHNQLKSAMANEDYEARYRDEYNAKIGVIKEYIKSLKERRRDIRAGEEDKMKEVLDVQDSKFKFLSTEIEQQINRLDKIFNLNEEAWKEETDESVSRRRKELPEYMKEVQALPTSLKDLMDCAAGVADASDMLAIFQAWYSSSGNRSSLQFL